MTEETKRELISMSSFCIVYFEQYTKYIVTVLVLRAAFMRKISRFHSRFSKFSVADLQQSQFSR